MTIRLNTLGAPECTRDGVVLTDLPTQRIRFALLAYLAIERNVSRDDAAALFWGDNGDERARHTLSQTVYELRRLLGETWLQTQSGRLVVTDELSVDVREFSQLCERLEYENAVALYHGPFLSGFFLTNSKGFETWVDRQRSQLERLHRRARRESVNKLLADNRPSAALEVARQWAELDPFEDEANHRLIELLALAGARADALREYDAYETRLRQELSLEPLDHTKELVQRLRSDSPAGFESFVPRVGESAAVPALTTPRRKRFSPIRVALPLAMLIGFASVWWLAMRPNAGDAAAAVTDTTSFALLPFDYGTITNVKLDEQQRLQEAFSRWSGATVADPLRVREAIGQASLPLRAADAQKIARRVGAGRYVLGSITRVGDSLRVYGVLYNTGDGEPLADRTMHLPVSLQGADSALMVLADALLFLNEPLPGPNALFATHSWPARRAFNRAQAAIREWDLARADTALTAAVKQDPEYAQAYLWLAQVRSWQRRAASEWLYAAQNAMVGKSRLTPREQDWARALVAFSRDDMPTACRVYEQLAKADELDFAAWYAWGDCLRRDSFVYADRDSPTGYYFRSSYRQALAAFEQAFLVMPSLLRAFRAAGYQETRNLFWTNASRPRGSRAPGRDEIAYFAYPVMNADTLAFFPMPFVNLLNGWGWARSHGAYNALQNQRREFLKVTQAWAAAYPEDADAKEALSVALELLGDNTALDTLQRARRLTRTKAENLRLAASEVWLLIKYSLPFDTDGLRAAAVLADTVLNDPLSRSAVDGRALVSLAALRGRAGLATKLAQGPTSLAELGLSRARASAAERLLIYAAFAGPRDKLENTQRELEAIGSVQTGDDEAWQTVQERAATLTYPALLIHLASGRAVRNTLLRAQLARSANRMEEVTNWLNNTRNIRAGVIPADVTIDVIYPEAVLLRSAYGDAAAARWLDPHVDALRFTAPEVFLDFTRSASLVRAMALRAEIAARMHDARTARQCATAVSILWNGADAFLQPTVEKMNALTKGKL